MIFLLKYLVFLLYFLVHFPCCLITPILNHKIYLTDYKHGNIEVDVKCSERGKYLYVKKKRLINHDHDDYWYALLKGDPKKYTGEFVGCITGKEFSNICKPYPENPESLSVRSDQLRPMSELYDRLKKGGHLNGQGVWK